MNNIQYKLLATVFAVAVHIRISRLFPHLKLNQLSQMWNSIVNTVELVTPAGGGGNFDQSPVLLTAAQTA